MSLGIFSHKPKMAQPVNASAQRRSVRGLGNPLEFGGFTWKNTQPDPMIGEEQQYLANILAKNGYNQIGVDGRIGPGTCGAWRFIANNIDTRAYGPDPAGLDWVNVCQGFTNPTRVGATKPSVDPIIKQISEVDVHTGQPLDASLPWLVASPNTVTAQNQINAELAANDLSTLNVDGKMGASMCGALRYLDKTTGSVWLSTYGKNCQAFTDPVSKKAPTPTAPPAAVVSVPATPPSESPFVPPPSKPKMTAASMATGLAALTLVGGLGYWYAKKKGLVG